MKSEFSILDNPSEQQPIKGEKVNRIGVKSGSFCEASCVEEIFKNISNLEPPKFENSENLAQDEIVSTPSLFQLIDEKLSKVVQQFKSNLNVLTIHKLLNTIPTLANEVLVALKYNDSNISNLFNNFIITRILIELKKSKEHQQLHSKLIECGISSCFNTWNCFKHLGINISNFEEFKQLLSLEIKTFSSQNNNILIPSFSNSTLPQII
jgi:hypothetical protein